MAPALGSFYLDPDGPLFSNVNASLTCVRAGLSIPRTVWLANGDRDLIRTMVDDLGGLPVVLKMPGYSSGVGIMRADSLPTIFGLVDYIIAEGGRSVLTTFIGGDVHWRVVLVGDSAVASDRNQMDDDDFRTLGSTGPLDYSAQPLDGCNDLAVKACQALSTAHGGVDALAHPSGWLFLLEANSPCEPTQAQLSVGVDIAGAMVDYLLKDTAARTT